MRTGIAFLAGLILSVAFEPLAIAYVMPVALAGFALTTRGLRPRQAGHFKFRALSSLPRPADHQALSTSLELL